MMKPGWDTTRNVATELDIRHSGRYRSDRDPIRRVHCYDYYNHYERCIPVSNLFQSLSDQEKLTDELFAFVTDPSADNRNERAIISVLHEVAPHMVSVAECMILDGVDERHYVADYVHAVVNGVSAE